MQEDMYARTIGLSVIEWHEMVLQGPDIPMSFKVNGSSMRPLIRKDRDVVTIVPLRRAPKVGEIVLFHRPGAKANYVLHRVWKVEGDQVRTFGDGCFAPDPWMPMSYIWGVAVKIERASMSIDPNSWTQKMFADFWMASWKMRRWFAYPQRFVAKIRRLAPHE